ncbi:MAG: hypothetical protein RLZ92_1012, partial [Pseudomonadota bacterium]
NNLLHLFEIVTLLASKRRIPYFLR